MREVGASKEGPLGRDDLAAYFKAAKLFDHDRLAGIARSRSIAWVVATGACVVAISCAGALASLAPLKTVAPYVIRVDQSTGLVDVVSGLTDAKEHYSDAISKYFITQYVLYRESYLNPDAADAFRRVSLMSSEDEQRRYALTFNASNPASPQNVYGKREVAQVFLKAISFLSPTLAQVRFYRMVRSVDGDDKDAVRQDFTATLTFAYSSHTMRDQDRLVNPLGFVVTSYRRDEDVSQ